VKPRTAKLVWVGKRQPDRPWMAQIESADGKMIETLTGDHETEALALAHAKREIAARNIDATGACGTTVINEDGFMFVCRRHRGHDGRHRSKR
jgi:hypothetical protein